MGNSPSSNPTSPTTTTSAPPPSDSGNVHGVEGLFQSQIISSLKRTLAAVESQISTAKAAESSNFAAFTATSALPRPLAEFLFCKLSLIHVTSWMNAILFSALSVPLPDSMNSVKSVKSLKLENSEDSARSGKSQKTPEATTPSINGNPILTALTGIPRLEDSKSTTRRVGYHQILVALSVLLTKEIPTDVKPQFQHLSQANPVPAMPSIARSTLPALLFSRPSTSTSTDFFTESPVSTTVEALTGHDAHLLLCLAFYLIGGGIERLRHSKNRYVKPEWSSETWKSARNTLLMLSREEIAQLDEAYDATISLSEPFITGLLMSLFHSHSPPSTISSQKSKGSKVDALTTDYPLPVFLDFVATHIPNLFGPLSALLYEAFIDVNGDTHTVSPNVVSMMTGTRSTSVESIADKASHELSSDFIVGRFTLPVLKLAATTTTTNTPTPNSLPSAPSALNSAILSVPHLLTLALSIPSLWTPAAAPKTRTYIPDWTLLYRGSTHGFSQNRFGYCVFNYFAPTLVVIHGKLKPAVSAPSTNTSKNIVLALYVPCTWKDSKSYWGDESTFFQILTPGPMMGRYPTAASIHTPPLTLAGGTDHWTSTPAPPPKFKANYILYNTHSSGSHPAGLSVGGDSQTHPRLFLDSTLQHLTLTQTWAMIAPPSTPSQGDTFVGPAHLGDYKLHIDVLDVECFGLGGEEVVQRQRKEWGFAERDAERRRGVNLKGLIDAGVDETILELAGITMHRKELGSDIDVAAELEK